MRGQAIAIIGLIGAIVGALIGEVIYSAFVDTAVETMYNAMYQANPTPITANIIANAKSSYNLLSVVVGAVGGLVTFMGIVSWLGRLSS